MQLLKRYEDTYSYFKFKILYTKSGLLGVYDKKHKLKNNLMKVINKHKN